jgi:adenylate kinase family enzyme
MHLSALGQRICVLGPSNSGKSTLADAVARKLDMPAIHLDQLFHVPNTDWQQRPGHEFVALHDAAIAGERWVMDGNYSVCMPQRLTRATGLIVLDVSTSLSMFRYFRRTLLERERRGALTGGRDSIKWEMIHHIAVVSRKGRQRAAKLFDEIDLPKIRLSSARQIGQCYRDWGLQR